MKIGKSSEAILRRSVLKQLKKRREEVVQGPCYGEQVAVLDSSNKNRVILSTNPFIGTKKEAGEFGIFEAINDVASTGAEPIAILVSILLPAKMEEKGLKRIMDDLRVQCQKWNVDIVGGHTEVTPAVNEPILTITAIGMTQEETWHHSSTIQAGQEIVMTKWCGQSGTARLALRKEKELQQRYPNDFLDGAKQMKEWLSIQEEMKVLKEYEKEWEVGAIHHVAKGGVFGALWEFASAGKVGLDIDLMKIPLKQETVEVCEFFDLNPYCLESVGCLLIAVSKGNELVAQLNRANIPAVLIGKVTKTNDRIIRNEEEERYLEPPKSDEINKIFAME